MANFIRLVLASLLAGGAYADSIDVDILAGRRMVVRERFSGAAGPLIFLASPCVRIEKMQAGGAALAPGGAGPWMTVAAPASAIELSYEATPVVARPRTCSLPLLMPQHPVEAVSVSVTDHGSGLARIAVPHLAETAGRWSAKFPAVPSQVELEWASGDVPPAAPRLPVGRFAWNFWGLISVLVTWTAAYLLWTRRGADES